MVGLKRTLTVIPEPAPDTRSVLIFTVEPPVIRGTGYHPRATDYQCGGCGVGLVENLNPDTLSNLVLQCPKCQAYNDVP